MFSVHPQYSSGTFALQADEQFNVADQHGRAQKGDSLFQFSQVGRVLRLSNVIHKRFVIKSIHAILC